MTEARSTILQGTLDLMVLIRCLIEPNPPNQSYAVPGLTRDLRFPGNSRRSRVKPGTARF